MKKFFASGILICSAFFGNAQPNFQWGLSFGNGSTANGYAQVGSILTDASGNIYSLGMLQGAADFDPGPGVAALTSAGSWDIYVSKLDPAGNLLWAKQIGGPTYEWARSMQLDPAGNIYLNGVYSGATDFDPGAGSYTLAASSSTVYNKFILKLDANGSFQWAKDLGFMSWVVSGWGNSAVDAAHYYVAGSFTGTVDFDPGPGTYTMNAPTGNIYLVKLDLSGNFVWALQFDGFSAQNLSIDAIGNIYASGTFSSTADFDPSMAVSNLTSYGGEDVFILKLNSNGGFVWVKQLGGNLEDQASNIEFDCDGNVISSGTFRGNFYANPASSVSSFSSFGQQDIFVSKLDGNGNYIWGKQIGGTVSEGAQIEVDKAGDIYLGGNFGTTAFWIPGFTTDFDPGPAVYTLSTAGGLDVFYCKLDAAGNFKWAYSVGTLGHNWGGYFCLSDNFDLHISGLYTDSVDVNPFSPVYNLNIPSPNSANFLIKLTQSNSLVPLITTTVGGLQICTGNSTTLTASGAGTFSWYPTNISTTALGTGTAFVTPALTTNTTIYVSSSVCGSVSAKVPATVTVVPLPVITASAFPNYICEGDVIALQAGGAATYTWSSFQSGPIIIIKPLASDVYTVTGTDTNFCASTAAAGFTVSKCLGTEESSAQLSSFRIYPNPASGEFFIESEGDLTFIISDEIGRIVRTISMTGEEKSQKTFDLPPGIFFITPDPLSGLKPQKLVILYPQ